MEILVIGGTRYFGIHMVNELLNKGHNVTIATRGKSPDPFRNKVSALSLTDLISKVYGIRHSEINTMMWL